MDFVAAAAATALILRSRKNRREKQRPWVAPMVNQRLLTGKFHKFFSEMRSSESKFLNYFQMSVECFDKLLSAVGPRIKYQNTLLRLAVPPEERLAVTLRYLSTGKSFHALHCEYLLGKSTISVIIKDTILAIWDCLVEEYMPTVNDSDAWLKIADAFYEQTSFPNCLGAVGSRCIPTNKKSESGSYLSTLLVAVADSDYSFTAVEVVTDDSSCPPSLLFQRLEFGRMLKNGELNIPSPRCLPNDEGGTPMPFVTVEGEGFSASDSILCPYSKATCVERTVFNCRLTRASKMVESCFAMMLKKWQILHKTLDVNVSLCSSIVKAACILHNFVRRHDGIQFEDMLYDSPLQGIKTKCQRNSRRKMKVRDYFAQYFLSPRGSVPWQYEEEV